jgi:hypothetical protein
MTHQDVDEANVFPNCLIRLLKHEPVEVVRWRLLAVALKHSISTLGGMTRLDSPGFLDFLFPKALEVSIWNDVRF